MEVTITLFAIVVLLLVALYVQLSRIIYEVRNLNILIRGISDHIIGDVESTDFSEIRQSLKELIVKRSCGIEKEIVKIRHGLFGNGDGIKTTIPRGPEEPRAPVNDQT